MCTRGAFRAAVPEASTFNQSNFLATGSHSVGSICMQPALKLEPLKHARLARTVMCVDDNEFVLEVLHWYLESLGYLVTRCVSGESAIAALEKELPDAVTLDFEMPKMDGGQVARAMKERAPQMPIV